MTTLGLGGACWFTYSCENQLTKIKLVSTYLLEAGLGWLVGRVGGALLLNHSLSLGPHCC